MNIINESINTISDNLFVELYDGSDTITMSLLDFFENNDDGMSEEWKNSIIESLRNVGEYKYHGGADGSWSLKKVHKPVRHNDVPVTENKELCESENIHGIDLNEFIRHYIVAMLWSSTGDDDEPLDKTYGIGDVSLESMETIKKDCRKFVEKCHEFITDDNYIGRRGADFTVESYAGHDFWLTRVGHGAGFWDGDWKSDEHNYPEGPLTKACKEFRYVDAIVGDDKKIYIE